MHGTPETLEPGIVTLVDAVRGSPHAMVNLARSLLLAKNKIEAARTLCADALALAPGDAELAAMARGVLTEGVGSWYWTMVQDDHRHALYAEAFRRVFTPGCTVLDIGAGTGLFAMLAAREGAGRVIGCERDVAVAKAAQEIVAANGYADRVTILAKDSRDLVVGEDIDPVDVILWDNLANNLIGAGGADTLEDARRRLARPDAIVIPCRAEIVVALVDDLNDRDRMMGMVDGFDMSAFDALRLTNFTMSIGSKWALRSDAATAFDVDFQGLDHLEPARATVTVTATGGRVVGIAQWVRFHLTPEIAYETNAPEVMAFGVQFHAVEPFATEPGDAVTVGARHDRALTWFWISPP